MTEVEKREIVNEVLCIVADQTRQANPQVLAPTHKKWFRDENGSSYNSLMTKVTGEGYISYGIWELVRRATCAIFGVRYVRQLVDADEANEVADKICQMIYDIGMERRIGKDGERGKGNKERLDESDKDCGASSENVHM